MTESLAKTPLSDWHATNGGRMVEFGGWSMPVQYTSIVSEHNATRTAVGLFDISHMGRLRLDGADAARFIDSLVTRRVDNLKPGRIRYALVTNHQGGVLDDILVYHLKDGDTAFHLLVVNASNREKIVEWIGQFIDDAGDVCCRDQTYEHAMISVQGPKALQLVGGLLDFDPVSMKYYTGRNAKIGDTHGIISRTGYTGEDGCELIVPSADIAGLWTSLLSKGDSLGALPVGLGARDTLRLEAAMPLYGHELTEQITPIQAGLDFAVDLDGRNFPGRDACKKAAEDPSLPQRVGLECEGRRVPREGYPITYDGATIGEVTSGTFSPTLGKPIAMGYVEPRASEAGIQVGIEVRGRNETARVVELPFYRRA